MAFKEAAGIELSLSPDGAEETPDQIKLRRAGRGLNLS
jgi:hypothetical protein